MTAQRIKGQEVQILITRDGNLEDTLTDIQNFDFEPMFELISKGYLGEKTERKDELFKGCKFSLELHIHAQDWFNFLKAIKDRAQRNTPDLVVNITAVLNFPNGDTPSVMIPDVKFGTNPHKIGSRGDYLSIKLEGESEDFDLEAA